MERNGDISSQHEGANKVDEFTKRATTLWHTSHGESIQKCVQRSNGRERQRVRITKVTQVSSMWGTAVMPNSEIGEYADSYSSYREVTMGK